MKSGMSEQQIDSLQSDIIMITIIEPIGSLGSDADMNFLKNLTKSEDEIVSLRKKLHGLTYKQIKNKAKNIRSEHVNRLLKEEQNIEEANKVFSEIKIDSIDYLPITGNNSKTPRLRFILTNNSILNLYRISGELIVSRGKLKFYEPYFTHTLMEPISKNSSVDILVELNDDKQNAEANLYLDGNPEIYLTSLEDDKGKAIEYEDESITSIIGRDLIV